MAQRLMTITSIAPRSFAKAIMQPACHPAIDKEIGNFIDNTCFQWIKDVGQRRMMMIGLFSFNADMTLKARLVVNGKMLKPGLDYNPDCGILRQRHSDVNLGVLRILSTLWTNTARRKLDRSVFGHTRKQGFHAVYGYTRWNHRTSRSGTTGNRKFVWTTIFWKKFQ